MVSFDLHVQQRKDAIAGLSYEKLKLMKEKKEEIEKVRLVLMRRDNWIYVNHKWSMIIRFILFFLE